MPRVLRHLECRDAGLLGWHIWPGRTVLVVQYWRSTAELHSFATDSSAPHAAAWRDFNRRVGSDGSVGIWHETYQARPGSTWSVYDNMPAFGLAAATNHTAVGRGRATGTGTVNHAAGSQPHT